MKMKTTSLFTTISVPCLALLLLALSAPPTATATFTWDKDTVEDCEERSAAARCINDMTTYYLCPETCSKHKQSAGVNKQGEAEDPDVFFELEVPLTSGKTMSFNDLEGYVTVLFVIPLLPGMAQYYYDMVEHIHKVYPFTLELLVVPVRIPSHPEVQLKIPTGDKKSKVVVLPEWTEGEEFNSKIEAHPVLKYLEETISPNPNHRYIFTDRVTAYIVAFNAKFIEKQASPTLDFMERLIAHYLQEMEWKVGEF